MYKCQWYGGVKQQTGECFPKDPGAKLGCATCPKAATEFYAALELKNPHYFVGTYKPLLSGFLQGGIK